MRICLIIPPSGFLLDERVFPSLGILKVAAALESLHHTVFVLDLSGCAQIAAELHEHFVVEQARYDVIGLTATMPQMPAAAEIAAFLHQRCRRPHGTRLILGGPHPTLLHASAKRGVLRAQDAFTQLTDVFDTVVCGDGEHAIDLAIRADAPEVIDADDPASPLFLTRHDLTAAPLPARHLIDLPSYRYQIDGLRTDSLIAQLGCPFGCHFCGGRRSPFLRRVRLRSTSSVLDEIRHLYERYGTRGFMFLDDELNVNREFTSLLDGLIELQESLHTEFRLRGLLKSELVTAPMARLMHRAGFRQILVGFESGSPRMLANMNKHATVEDNTRCVDLLHSAGIRVKALMSFGHPGESPETVYDTEQWLRTVRPDDFDVTIITVYPGTPYYEDARGTSGYFTYTAASGDRLHMIDTDHLKDVNFYKGIPGNYQSFVWTDALSREGLVAARDAVEADVRRALAIPYPTGPAATQYEHSMGAR